MPCATCRDWPAAAQCAGVFGIGSSRQCAKIRPQVLIARMEVALREATIRLRDAQAGLDRELDRNREIRREFDESRRKAAHLTRVDLDVIARLTRQNLAATAEVDRLLGLVATYRTALLPGASPGVRQLAALEYRVPLAPAPALAPAEPPPAPEVEPEDATAARFKLLELYPDDD